MIRASATRPALPTPTRTQQRISALQMPQLAITMPHSNNSIVLVVLQM